MRRGWIRNCFGRHPTKAPNPDPNVGTVLLVVFPGRRPIVRSYKLGESWYAHEHDILSDWRVKLLPGGKIEGSYVVEAWEPVSQNMVEFFHSRDLSKIPGEPIEKAKNANLPN